MLRLHKRLDFGHFIMSLFEERGAVGYWHPAPNHGITFRWNRYPEEPQSYECCVLNSESPSDQVWLGSNDRWYKMYSGPEFRKMAVWVLLRWLWHDWFGLKTRLWLFGLHLACREYKIGSTKSEPSV